MQKTELLSNLAKPIYPTSMHALYKLFRIFKKIKQTHSYINFKQ